MNFKDFLKDKIPFAVIYFLATAAVILVMYLTLIINKIELMNNNILYAWLISIIFFILFLIYDYLKNRHFYNQLNVMLNAKEDLDNILNIGNCSTHEQEMFKKLLLKTYKIYSERTIKYEETHKEYINFINKWVHQMKTPVSVMNLILQDEINEDNRAVFDSILEENEKLSHGLDMMLCNARVNEFNMDFNVESLNIISIVRNVLNDNKKPLIRSHVFPKVTTDAAITVETDKKWIYFVINQIVVNAIKYSKLKIQDNKYITFKIKAKNSKIILSISDEGIGIPKEDLNRVFNAFFTGKNGRKSDESTGMGMYLAKKICDKLGHEILVESEEGKGSTFSIVFFKGKNLFKF
ncbi:MULTISPECIES: sensor histidine kinase [Clostridium]|uniref:histidine kinase n=3 Tax=Clostridium TaxID=1485 RepID=D8GM60_CLOLD|nr:MULTISPECIES: sensor histidine kinase [Clostridium]ADK15634.1 predicted two-component sensor histidine kinase [Clostridium ljungdahlii DSM 13528]AGY74874.1 sensor histidine kinase [Clostridium autoethanogenum DSM 10061]ALU35051.1 Signal transduction histidine kinase containing EnzV-like and ATP-binding domains [Clostridium autoethanogenum DSM 10061]OAA86517.1 Sensor histidine kinase GraS [Clostridium ljungdahlii DSM 13528]OVY49450.1 Sensor histidine kinase GraS [Clostridium autoethanogenum]